MPLSNRILLTLYTIGMVIAMTWVPWKLTMPSPRFRIFGTGSVDYFVGYGFVWSGPAPWRFRHHVPALANYDDESIVGGVPAPKIDRERLLLELGALTAFLDVCMLVTGVSRGHWEAGITLSRKFKFSTAVEIYIVAVVVAFLLRVWWALPLFLVGGVYLARRYKRESLAKPEDQQKGS